MRQKSSGGDDINPEASTGPAWWSWAIGVLLLTGAAVLAGILVARREATAWEKGLMESYVVLIPAIVSAWVSWVLSNRSAETAAERRLHLHAHPAFRRVLHLYQGLSRLSAAIQERRALLESEASRDAVAFRSVRAAFDLLDYMVIEQIATANDAMEDWRDIAPEEVKELERRVRADDNEYTDQRAGSPDPQ